MSAVDDPPGLPDTLDTITCLRLGEGLFRVLAGLQEDPDAVECDEVLWEDAGPMVTALIVLDRDTCDTVQTIIDNLRNSPTTKDVQP